MYGSIGNNQFGGMPPYNYLYSASQILTQTSPYYYANYQGQGGFHGGYSRDFQMGFQGGNNHHMMGLSSLNYIAQSSTSQQQQQQLQQYPQSHQQQQQQQLNNNQQTQHHPSNQLVHRNSESHEKDNHSKDRSIKRNNSNINRDRSNEKLSFNKSTPHFYPQSENQNNHNNSSGGNHQSSSSNNNSGHVFMTSSNGAASGNSISNQNNINNNNNNNNQGSQTNLKDNDKINQIQKIYNNNIRSRNNFHKSQNNFYNTHTNTFFNSNNTGANNNNGSLDQRKKNGLSSRLSQSPSTDMKMAGQASNTNIRKYYPSSSNLKLIQNASSTPSSNSQNQNPLASFQKENNNFANIYSKDYKTNRNSLTSGKAMEKKDTVNQIYKPPIKGSLNSANTNFKHLTVVNPSSAFGNTNGQSKFYQTEPNFNKKPSKKSFQIIKPSLKPQLKPIEDIMNENMTGQNQIGRKYFSNTSTNQNSNLLNGQGNKWALTPKQSFNSYTSINKQKKKDEIVPLSKKSKTFGGEDRKNTVQERDTLIDNQNYDYDYDMEYDEPSEQQQQQQQQQQEQYQQQQQKQKNPEQLYSYDIEIDQPLSSSFSKAKLLTQVDEENPHLKNTLVTNEDFTQDGQFEKADHEQLTQAEKTKKQHKGSKDFEQKNIMNSNEEIKKDDEKAAFQKYPSYPVQQSNYMENRKSNNNFELEVIEEQNKEDEVKELPADLLQQVLKISESRPKTSEGGRRRRKLKQLNQQDQQQETTKKNEQNVNQIN